MTAILLENGVMDGMGEFERGRGRTIKEEDRGLEQREERHAEERHFLAKL